MILVGLVYHSYYIRTNRNRLSETSGLKRVIYFVTLKQIVFICINCCDIYICPIGLWGYRQVNDFIQTYSVMKKIKLFCILKLNKKLLQS